MVPTLEHERATEHEVLGRYEIAEVTTNDLVRLPQVRGGMNPQLESLKRSIKARGLINQIDVAHITQEQLDTYIAFVNKIWRTDVDPAIFEPQRQFDDTYYLVCAGHSRTEAVAQLEGEMGVVLPMDVKVHKVTDPLDILGIQLDENIHSEPSPERRAMAVVEMYFYGLEEQIWKNKADFLRQKGDKLSPTILNEAIGFAQLPADIMDAVYEQKIPYGIAVELGMASGTIWDYEKERGGYTDETLREDSTKKLDEDYHSEVTLILAHIDNENLSIKSARKYIKGRVREMKEFLDHAEVQPSLFLMPAEAQSEINRRRLVRALAAAKQDRIHYSESNRYKVEQLQRQLLGDDVFMEVEKEFESRLRVIGGSAARQLVQLTATS